MTTPFPGFATPNPRTWSAGDFVTTPRLRGDCTNLGALYAGGARPLLAAQCGIQSVNSGTVTLMEFSAQSINTWQVPVLNAAQTNPLYQVPLAGFWLVQADTMFPTPTSSQAKYATGFTAVVNGAAAANTDGGAVPASTSSSTQVGAAGAELYQLNTFAATADTVAWYGFQTSGSTVSNAYGSFAAEWVGLPSSGLTSYSGPYGTVVSSPVAALSWPPGPGTTVTNGGGIAAGATSVTVADATGMIIGGTLGLDYISGQPFQPYAEVVTITGISGLTISISATAYAHLQNAPVAVPVSHQFLNQQVRDTVRFLAYPPLLRAAPTTTQSIASGTSGVQITNMAASTDNFSGFASNQYTVPVSGVYFAYGQVYYAGSTSPYSYAAGVSISGGSILWGTVPRTPGTTGVQALCATFRRHLRLKAGQTVQLFGFQNSGSPMNTAASGSVFSKLIVVFRSF